VLLIYYITILKFELRSEPFLNAMIYYIVFKFKILNTKLLNNNNKSSVIIILHLAKQDEQASPGHYVPINHYSRYLYPVQFFIFIIQVPNYLIIVFVIKFT